MEEVAQDPEYSPNQTILGLELLEFKVSLFQDSGHTGSTMNLKASVLENNEPLKEVKVWARVALPDGSEERVDFEEVKPGHFGYGYKTTIDGEYRFHVHVKGATNAGRGFVEERTLSGAVYTDFT